MPSDFKAFFARSNSVSLIFLTRKMNDLTCRAPAPAGVGEKKHAHPFLRDFPRQPLEFGPVQMTLGTSSLQL